MYIFSSVSLGTTNQAIKTFVSSRYSEISIRTQIETRRQMDGWILCCLILCVTQVLDVVGIYTFIFIYLFKCKLAINKELDNVIPS